MNSVASRAVRGIPSDSELRSESVQRTAERKKAVIVSSTVGIALAITIVPWRAHWPFLAGFVITRLISLAYNVWLCQRILRMSKQEIANDRTLIWRLAAAFGVGGAAWGLLSFIAIPDAGTSVVSLVLLLLLIVTSGLMLITLSHLKEAMLAFIISQWKVVLVGLYFFGSHTTATLIALIAVIALVGVLLSYGLMLHREVRAGIAAQLVNQSLLQELGEVNGKLEDALAKAVEMARTDPLTGAFNRRAFYDYAARHDVARQRNPSPCCVAVIDLDHFKVVNDRYGHEMGDAVLRRTVQVLTARLRAIDTVARWGGEEFTLLLPDCDIKAAAKLCNELRLAIEAEALDTPQGVLRWTASIGGAAWIDGEALDPALARADQGVYAAKAQGRNRVVVTDEPAAAPQASSADARPEYCVGSSARPAGGAI